MKETAQKIETIVNWMQQLDSSILNFFLIKHQFLSDLSDEYKSVWQILNRLI